MKFTTSSACIDFVHNVTPYLSVDLSILYRAKLLALHKHPHTPRTTPLKKYCPTKKVDGRKPQQKNLLPLAKFEIKHSPAHEIFVPPSKIIQILSWGGLDMSIPIHPVVLPLPLHPPNNGPILLTDEHC